MADRTTGQLPAVQEVPIGSLPGIANLYDDTLIPVEQQGEAMHMTGRQWKGYAQAGVEAYVESARTAADRAGQLAQEASGFAGLAEEQARAAAAAKTGAEAARDGAREARQAIEDMTVSADTLPPGSEAEAVKTAAGGSFHLRFGIPAGKQGATGPQGADGIQGPPGRDGVSGVAVPEAGQYAFNVNGEGHLILSYTGDTAPEFSVREDGHLYLNIS